jgi:hypothetical protein
MSQPPLPILQLSQEPRMASTTFDPAAARPAPLAPLVAYLLIVVVCLGSLQWGEALDVVVTLKVADGDDALRLVEVRDLLHGQSWFDLTQRRYLAPQGVPMHWSRLVDLPLAAATLALTPFLGETLAFGVVAASWPPLLFLVFLIVLYAALRFIFDQRCAYLGVLAAGATPMLCSSFQFGRVDHHNVQALATTLMVLCVIASSKRPALSWVAGLAAAFSLAVGLETIPYVVLAGFFLGCEWIIFGKPAAMPILRFATSLSAGAMVLFAAQTPAGNWVSARCDALSAPWLLACGLGAAFMGISVMLAPGRTWQRAGLAALVGGTGALSTAWLFPECLDGPWGEVPKDLRMEWLGRIHETRDAFEVIQESFVAGLAIYVPLALTALLSSVLSVVGAPRHRRAFALLALVGWCGLTISLAQVRGAYVASVFVPIVAAYVVERALSRQGPGTQTSANALALLALGVAMFGKVWGIGAVFAQPEAENVKAEKLAGQACRQQATLSALDALAPGTILAPMNLGPFLLLHTHHSIVSGSYHRAPAGIEADFRAFESEEALRRYAARHHADYVALCDLWPARADAGGSFGERLAKGLTMAPWLDAAILDRGPLRVWRVRH